jgi:triosephosphate isomerase
MKKSTPFIVGNWKLNPASFAEATTLASVIARKQKQNDEPAVAIAPPFVYLHEVGKKIAKSAVMLAAQDVSHQPVGPYTGEVSVVQLKELGVTHIIIGHSERRAMGESDELIQKKVLLTLKYGLRPIVCVGERARDDSGHFYTFVEAQLRSLAEVLTAPQMKKIIVAYEPIWAIGTGKTATSDDVKEMQLFIESVLTKLYDRGVARAVRLLYGGSVKPSNAAELYREGGMQGFLVGGASLKSDAFMDIIKHTS